MTDTREVSDRYLAAVRDLAKRDAAILDWLGVKIKSISAEEVILTMTVTAQMINSQSLCHGGFVFSLADTACAYAAAAAGVTPVTIDANIAFLSAARCADRLEASGRLTRAGNRTAHGEASVWLSDGTEVARYRAVLVNRGG